MNILVTGGEGFIGSHLCEALVSQGFNVRALCQYNSFGSVGWLENSPVRHEIDIVFGDIRDVNNLSLHTKNINIIYNLAALISIPYSYTAIDSYVQTNILGTVNICNVALRNSIEKIVHFSTSEVYGTALYTPIDEKHPLQPQSPYSATKVSADALVKSFSDSFNLPIIIARPFNTYGPRQSTRAIIPTILTQIINGESQITLGNVKTVRDFNYVSDTVDGAIKLLSADFNRCDIYNIGSGSGISILNLFNLIKEVTSYPGEFLTDFKLLRPEKSEVYELIADINKIKTIFGYKPRVSFKEGIFLTYEWFKKNLARHHEDFRRHI